MRDWNWKEWKNRLRISHMFLSYLWGIETKWDWLSSNYENLFLSYLWGIETVLEGAAPHMDRGVSILPMRDWNLESVIRTKKGIYVFLSYLWGIETKTRRTCGRLARRSFYLTYEGLKPRIGHTNEEGHIRVSILPMRDWNKNEANLRKIGEAQFLSYLWGIETWRRSSIQMGRRKVSILPMRDWNVIAKKNRGLDL